jgi:hypothetical protein
MNEYPFLLSYARRDSKIAKLRDDGKPLLPDPHFEAFLQRLNQKVVIHTGRSGFVDETKIRAGDDWPEKLAEALSTAQTMVCLYSPSYFMSEHCGKEMQLFLERRRNYIRTKFGKAPANIIPLIWHSASDNIPKTLPQIHYQAPDLDAQKYGAWDLGDMGRTRDLESFADEIALRVRDAARNTPLPHLSHRPRMGAVQNAFHPPPLPLPEFDLDEAAEGPNAVTFVYAASTRWNDWPWAPPDEHAVLHLAAAVAKGKEMESNQLRFDLNKGSLINRLISLRAKNNVVILLVEASSLYQDGLAEYVRDYDRPEHSSFAMIVIGNNNLGPQLDARLSTVLPNFARRAPPHFYVVDDRDRFSDVVGRTIDELRSGVLRDPRVTNPLGHSVKFQALPLVDGPAQYRATT